MFFGQATAIVKPSPGRSLRVERKLMSPGRSLTAHARRTRAGGPA